MSKIKEAFEEWWREIECKTDGAIDAKIFMLIRSGYYATFAAGWEAHKRCKEHPSSMDDLTDEDYQPLDRLSSCAEVGE
jgi:hypothetical protein